MITTPELFTKRFGSLMIFLIYGWFPPASFVRLAEGGTSAKVVLLRMGTICTLLVSDLLQGGVHQAMKSNSKTPQIFGLISPRLILTCPP